MKKFFALCLSLVMVFSISGCDSSSHEGEAKTPSGSSIQQGRDYQAVIEAFKDQGFTNIKLVEMDDLVTGWLTKEGEVESVTVDGDENYSADAWYPNDVEVVITYHVFSGDNAERGENESQEPSTSESDPNETTPTEEIFTVDNCDEFAKLLAIKAENDPAYSKFADDYKNKIIEFDGCITYMTNHEDYDTRFDILISAGDYVDENTSNPGPIFKFEDVGIYDFGFGGLEFPDFVKTGSNIKIKAEVENFNSDTGLFKLDPISIEAR